MSLERIAVRLSLTILLGKLRNLRKEEDVLPNFIYTWEYLRV